MEVNFLNQKPCIPSWPGAFQFDILFSVIVSKSTWISILRPSSSLSSSLVILFIHSAFSLFLWFSYFSPKSLGFFCIRLLVCFCVTPSQLLIDFFSLFWKALFCLYCFTLCRYLFNLLSLASTFWFISSSCTVIFSPCCLFLLPPPTFISAPLFLIIRTFFRIFFICDSSLISHPGFCCCFVLFEGIPIFSQTNFAPA